MAQHRIVSTQATIEAPAAAIFELIADPASQPDWDGNDNLAVAESGQRVGAAGEVFTMKLTNGSVRQNHVVEFAEGELIAWKPSDVDQPPPGHLWRWELVALDDGRTAVTHTYDWTQLTDQQRLTRAEATTAQTLRNSVARLKNLAETD